MTPLLWQQHREQVPHAPPLSNNSSAKISRTITRCCQRVLSQRQAEEPDDDDDDDDEMNPIKNSRTEIPDWSSSYPSTTTAFSRFFLETLDRAAVAKQTGSVLFGHLVSKATRTPW
jgi:hypothetical protein